MNSIFVLLTALVHEEFMLGLHWHPHSCTEKISSHLNNSFSKMEIVRNNRLSYCPDIELQTASSLCLY